MTGPPAPYAELEVGLHRLTAEAYQVELRFTDPESEAAVPPEKGPADFDLVKLRPLMLDPQAYGETVGRADAPPQKHLGRVVQS